MLTFSKENINETLFKRYYGQTSKQYITDKQIERAKELLVQGIGICDTCFDIGLKAQAHLVHCLDPRKGSHQQNFKKSNFRKAGFNRIGKLCSLILKLKKK